LCKIGTEANKVVLSQLGCQEDLFGVQLFVEFRDSKKSVGRNFRVSRA